VVTTSDASCGERLTVTVGWTTVRAIVADCDKVPDEPVVVTVAFPKVAVLLALSVNVLVLVVLGGLNDAVTPFGKLEADRLTLPINPFFPIMVIVLVAVPPWPTLGLVGDAVRVKLGSGALPLPPPPHPVRVSVAARKVQKHRMRPFLENELRTGKSFLVDSNGDGSSGAALSHTIHINPNNGDGISSGRGTSG
jgi:hypothetical protein